MCIRDRTRRIPIIASLVETMFGAVNKPTAQVKITNDITLGFINLNNSERLNKSSWLKLLFFSLELSIDSKCSYFISRAIFVYPDHLQILAIPQKYGNLVEMAQSTLTLLLPHPMDFVRLLSFCKCIN